MSDRLTSFARCFGRRTPRLWRTSSEPMGGMDRELAGKDRFYSVTLSGNAGRIVVRHWMQITVAQARENLREWFSDLEIVSLSPK